MDLKLGEKLVDTGIFRNSLQKPLNPHQKSYIYPQHKFLAEKITILAIITVD